jgi:tetraacyldisaccharide 4'-kinase
MGGTGKTPMVEFVVRRLQAAGRRPGIVSRGYGREGSPAQLVLVSDGQTPPALLADARTAGDEPALLARQLPGVPVAVCADRIKAATELMQKCDCDCIVLDDGFQHLAMARNADIVLLDATRHLARQRVCPAGDLREPPSALRRAAAVVHTRVGSSPDHTADNEALVSELFPSLPQFRARFVSDRLTTADGRDVPDLPTGPTVACAGIAHPDQFFASLRALGLTIHPLPLRDHVRYDSQTIEKIAQAARSHGTNDIIVTAKDAVKIDANALPAPLRLLILRQRVELEPLAEFDSLLQRAVPGQPLAG